MDISIQKKYWLRHPAIILLTFALTILLIRIFLRGHVLLLDESEQVVMAQELLPGYPNQPPLYTWLQYAFFKFFGVNLLSLALLKSCLLFGCFYSFYLICRIHCEDNMLAWCALLSWALIPSICLDLIKDNTHSILVLFTACLTWYWFVAAERFSKFIWYSCLGCLIAIGFLAKFNYLLFLSILFFSSLTIKEFRALLIHPYMMLSFLIAAVLISPYLSWLIAHTNLGLASAYKLHVANSFFLQGPLVLIKSIIFFAAPVLLVLTIFFPRKRTIKHTKESKLLFRYHLFILPVLGLFILSVDLQYFEARWLIPILFLCPLLYLSQVKYTDSLKARITSFISISLITQLVFFGILIFSSHSEQAKRKQFPLNTLVNLTKANLNNLDYVVSDSYWLLGNLATALSIKNIWLIQPSKEILPKGKSLILWKREQVPYWVNLFAETHLLTELNFIYDSQSKKMIAGQAYAYQ
ncbi:ArnT family glycosyltransferase [Legionella cardiaca]|uniref:Glycosyltransferase family 39 protein n=1 Tax=Legionella cardiaca TaxID=1071983 RepID=A0ABY8AVR8_9GAMM|nr:glycosyltransferase family 39 protein [Legionella cardiaca]WED43824.1 glycosyltransferase family 39 protein [Legionella cardiaca]